MVNAYNVAISVPWTILNNYSPIVLCYLTVGKIRIILIIATLPNVYRAINN